MKLMKFAALFLGLTALSVPAATLNVGDPAPKLQTGKWVQGEPVKEFSRTNAYIVEFWATWCGPCRASIPHLNEIYQKFKDKGLVVIGQNVWERDESLVAPFVKKMGDKMTYRVALDDKKGSEKGKMAETWMEAAGQDGIPAAFLVDKVGKIAWLGHPMALKETVIEQVLAGKHDLKQAAADYKKQQDNEETLMKLSRDLQKAMQAKDWDKADSTVAELTKVLTEEQQQGLDMVRLQILAGKGDDAGAGKLLDKMTEANKDNSGLLNEVAWGLAARYGLKGELLAAAAKTAARANTLSEGKDPAILDTVARLTFMQGDKAKAVELQEKAVALAKGDMKTDLQKSLDSYKEGKLPKLD